MPVEGWRFKMPGTFEVTRGEVPIAGIHRHKHCLLLAYLAYKRGKQSRDSLAAKFWPQTDDGSNNLSQAIVRLTRLLDLPRLSPDTLLQSSDGTLGLSSELYTRDLDDFNRLLKRADKGTDDEAKIADYTDAVKLYRGEFLLGYPVGNEYDWIAEPRADYGRKFAHALKSLGELFRDMDSADLAALCEEHAGSMAPLSGEEQALLENWREAGHRASGPKRKTHKSVQVSNAGVVASYNHGRRLWKIRAHAPLMESLEWFAQAIAADATYAPAYAGMADTYSLLGYYSYMTPGIAIEHAKDWAGQALERMEGASQAAKSAVLTADAWIKMIYDWEWIKAEEAFIEALEMNPANETAHQWYSYYLMLQGSTQQSLEEINTAWGLEPQSGILSKSVGERYYYKGLHTNAIEKYRDALKDAPHYCLTHYCLGKAYEQQALLCQYAGLAGEVQDNFEEALAAFEQAIRLADAQAGPQSPSLAAGLAHACARSGDPARSRLLLAQLQMQRETEGCYVSPVALATIHAGLDEPDAALDHLELALNEHPGDLVLVPIDPRFVCLRDNARFTNVVRRIGLEHVPSPGSEPCL